MPPPARGRRDEVGRYVRQSLDSDGAIHNSPPACKIVIMITNIETQRLLTNLTPLLPGDWFVGSPTLTADDEEILIVGDLSPASPGAGDASAFREVTRKQRMQIAKQIELATQRSVAWGVRTQGATTIFTSFAIPVMTRLRIGERDALDTLVAGGVAKSRSDAAAWCVRFVAQREASWLADLRTTLEGVATVRSEGPRLA